MLDGLLIQFANREKEHVCVMCTKEAWGGQKMAVLCF